MGAGGGGKEYKCVLYFIYETKKKKNGLHCVIYAIRISDEGSVGAGTQLLAILFSQFRKQNIKLTEICLHCHRLPKCARCEN